MMTWAYGLPLRNPSVSNTAMKFATRWLPSCKTTLANFSRRVTRAQRQQYFRDPRHLQELVPVLSNPDREAVVIAFGTLREIATPDQIKPMLDHNDPFVRLVALRKLEPENKFLAGELCIEMFSRTNLNYQWLASQTLQSLTGQKISGSEPWKKWWSENKESFRSSQK